MSYPELLEYISAPHLGWTLLLIATIGDAALPMFLGLFVQRYSHMYEPMSALAARRSPVRSIYRKWLVFAGLCFLFASPQIFYAYREISTSIALTASVCVSVYGTGACILAGIFPSEDGQPQTKGEWIHGIASALGFIALIASALLLGLLLFSAGEPLLGTLFTACFGAACTSFALFVLSDKDRFAYTAIARMGLWQRIAMVFAYLPIICISASNL